MRKVGLEARVLGLFGLLVGTLVAASLMFVHLHMTERVREQVLERLHTAQRVFDELLATRAEGLIRQAALVAELPVIRRAVDSPDAPNLSFVLRETNRMIGTVVVILTDRLGVIFARSDRRWENRETFDQTTSVARALRGERAASMWVQEGRLYQMVSVPVRLPSGLAGTLSLGYGVDAELARELARLSGNDIAFLVGTSVVAASRQLSPREEAALAERVARLGVEPAFGNVDLDGELPAFVVSPFFGPGASQVGAYAVLRSVAGDAAELRALERRLGGSALVALLAVLGIGWLISRSITRPLTALSAAAGELAAGNYEYPLPRPTGAHEVEDLTRAFEAMRRSLRARIQELHDLAERLEDSVRQRTAELEAALAENRRLLQELKVWSDELERKVEARTHELAEAEKMLVRQDRMAAVGRLAAGIAHEINNPLGILAGFADGLLDRARSPELAVHPDFRDFPEYLRLIGNEVDRLKTIVQKFLNFSRSRGPQKELMSLNDVAKQVLELLANHARREGKRLLGELAGSDVLVEADPEQLKQVLLNLALNGLDAVTRGGTVRIATAAAGEHAEVRVEDDGVGVPPELRARIFEPFFSTKAPEQGTGLGLALCADLVRENGGEIELAPLAEGEGTTFVVRLARVKGAKLRAHA